MRTEVDYRQLHEADEPKLAPWVRESRLVSMADIMLGGYIECDYCRRWQRTQGFDSRPQLFRDGWIIEGVKDKCPICAKGNGNG